MSKLMEHYLWIEDEERIEPTVKELQDGRDEVESVLNAIKLINKYGVEHLIYGVGYKISVKDEIKKLEGDIKKLTELIGLR
jgi:hypothetical protein